MSIFGDLETPAAKRRPPEKKGEAPPSKPLAKLSLTVHKAITDEARGRVHLSASAGTGFADGTAGSAVPVSFFLKGTLLATIETDEFGLASLEHGLDASLLKDAHELTARVRGFASEAKAYIPAKESHLQFKEIQQRWLDEVVVRCKRFLGLDDIVYAKKQKYLFGLIKNEQYVWGCRLGRSPEEWQLSRVPKRLFISGRLSYRDEEFSAEGLVVDVFARYSNQSEEVWLGTGRACESGEFQCTCEHCYLADEWDGYPSSRTGLVRDKGDGTWYLVPDSAKREFLLSSVSGGFEAIDWPTSWRLYESRRQRLICDFGKGLELMDLQHWPRLEPHVTVKVRGVRAAYGVQQLEIDGTSDQRWLRRQPTTTDGTTQ